MSDSSYNPLTRERTGLTEEDAAALGMDDVDDMSDATDDPMVSSDNAAPYMAPTDPPVVPGGRDGIEVADGFAATSEGAADRAGSPGDDDITARVHDLLRGDAATTSLELDVETIDGVVYLRGMVQTLDDSDMAAEVASRVPGVVEVVEVVDEMTVQE